MSTFGNVVAAVWALFFGFAALIAAVFGDWFQFGVASIFFGFWCGGWYSYANHHGAPGHGRIGQR